MSKVTRCSSECSPGKLVAPLLRKTGRSDAERNRALIIETALRLFRTDRAVTMDDIVEASDLGRTTVFRHFRRRDDLLEVLLHEVVGAVEERLDEYPLEAFGSLEAFRFLSDTVVSLTDRFGFVMAMQVELLPFPDIHTRFEAITQRIVALCSRAQKDGLLQGDVSPEWLSLVFFGISTAVFESAAQGTIDVSQANKLLLEQFLHGAGVRK